MDRRQYALALAKQEFKLFPLVTNTKLPLKDTDGYKSATSDLEAISGWFTVDPYINIGLRLDTTNLLVVDVDRHNSSHNGVISLAKLKETGYKLPMSTYGEQTPGDGLHLFFKLDGNQPHKRVNWRPGIDILTDFVVIAPSVIDGKSYQPLSGTTLAQVKPLPDWLINDLTKEKVNVSRQSAATARKTWAGRWLDDLVQGSTTGNRNVFLTSLVGKILNTGCQSETAYELLQYANGRLGTPLPDKEVNQIFLSILKRLGG